MRYEVLGTIEALAGAERIELGGAQQRRLLGVLLASRDRVVSVDRLIDSLWPDGTAPAGATRAVFTYISRLRASLGDGSIQTRGGGYVLRVGEATVDAAEFEAFVERARAGAPDQAVDRYRDALALWRGQAFGEFAGEWWAIAEAARLEELRALAREERALACIALGQSALIIPELESMFVEDPLRDGIARALMEAFDAAGRKAEALRVFQHHRRHLIEATGLEPSAGLIELERSIASEDASLRTPGRPLRGYVLHEVIGRGAHGTVYAARQPGTERDVAIKVIRAEYADSPEFVRRFELEAQLVARLEHPHIVPLYDFWREPGGAFLVCRLLRGGTAEESLISGGRWSLGRVSALVEQVGSALITAHAAGVAHGDLRPSNILLDGESNTFVSDFGIATERRTDHPSGDGVTTDIAQLAATVWELLTGEAPMPSAWRDSLPSLIDRIPTLPSGIDAVIARATSSRERDRFESMADFVLAWRAVVARSDVSLEIGGLRATSSDRRLAARQMSLRAASDINPYRGLRPFAETDSREFFGRRDVAAALHATVARSRFVAVVGASGLGKSSLVFAGLVPLIRAAGRKLIASMTPGDDPMAALHSALIEISVSSLDVAEPVSSLRSVAAQSSGGLLLIVDQFEECWTLLDADRRDAFIAVLAACVHDGQPNLTVVVTLRADMYDRPLAHPLLGPLIAAETFPLIPMGAADLEQAVGLPAARAHVDFEDGIVSSMVTEAVANPASLPLLQFTLYELFERRVDGVITTAVYEELGGVAGAIASRAEHLFATLAPDDQERTRRLFERLVTPGHGVPDSRRRCLLGELLAGTGPIAEQFVASRLLVADHDPVTREPTVELAHESLLTTWSRLGSWIDDDRRWLAQLHHLTTAARAWEQSGRSPDELYRGSRLEAALEELPLRHDDLTEVEVSFVEAGRTARDAELERDRRSVRRLRRLLVGVAALLVVALVSGSIAYVQRRAADRSGRQARIGALVGDIGTVRATRRDTAALLAIEAFRLADTPATRSALFSTFTASPGFLDLHYLDAAWPSFTGAVIEDRVFVLDGDNRVRPYDLETGRIGEPFEAAIPARMVADRTGTPNNPPRTHVTSLVGSPDGALIAQLDGVLDPSGAATTTIAMFDSVTGTTVADVVTLPMPAGTMAISPASSGFVVSGGYEGSVAAVDRATGAITARLAGLPPSESLANQLWQTAGLAYLDADRLAVGSVADTIRIVDPTTLAPVEEPIGVPDNTTTALVALDHGAKLLGTGLNGVVLVDVRSRSVVWALDFRDVSPGACRQVSVVAERSTFYCFDSFGRLEERDLVDGSRIRQLDAQNGEVGSVWAARHGTELVAFNLASPVVARWRLDGSGPITRRIAPGLMPSQYSPDGTQLIAFRPFGAYLADAIAGTSVIVDASSGEVVAPLAPLEFGFWNDDDTIGGIVPIDQGAQPANYEVTAHQVVPTDLAPITVQLDRNVTNSGQPKLWVSTQIDDDTWEIWTAARPSLARIDPTITVDSLVDMSGSPGGHRLAVTTTNGVILYDADTGAEMARIDQRDDLRRPFFVDDRLLAISSVSGELALYDADTLAVVRTLNGNRGFIEDVQPTRDGSLVAVRGGDRSVQLIDVASGTPIGGPISIPLDESRTIVLQPSGHELAVGGGNDDGIAIWDLDPADWVAAACRLAGRNLTDDEWTTYIGSLAPYHETCAT